MLNRLLRDLPQRAVLTVRTYGWLDLLARLVTAPLRPFRLERGLRRRLERRSERRTVSRWYGEQGRPVLIVIPTYGDPEITFAAVKGIRRTTDSSRTRIVVVDDASRVSTRTVSRHSKAPSWCWPTTTRVTRPA